MAQSRLTTTSISQVQVILLPQPPKLLGITGRHYHAWLTFVFLVEKEFCHVGQASLELLTSGDLPALASQSAEITGVSWKSFCCCWDAIAKHSGMCLAQEAFV